MNQQTLTPEDAIAIELFLRWSSFTDDDAKLRAISDRAIAASGILTKELQWWRDENADRQKLADSITKKK